MSEADVERELGETYFKLDAAMIENSRLRAEVERLKFELEQEKVNYSKSLNNMGYENVGLRAENERLRAALEAIANADVDDYDIDGRPNYRGMNNPCEYARDALEAKP